METEILTPFLNRTGEFKPGDWFQLVPKGVFPISRKEKDGKVRHYTQVVDDTAIQKMDQAFKNRRTSNPAFRLLVDFEHFSHDTSKSSAAACWVTDTEPRTDGLWAKGEWSDEGEAAIKNRRYRFLSPVWFPNQTEKIGDNKFRPVEVNDAGLTNKPNLGDALQPFWNREGDEKFNGREANPENQTRHMKDRLLVICGLAATATDEQIVAAVEGFKNRASQFDSTKSQLDTLNADNTALKNRYDKLLGDSVGKTLEDFKGVITEESKDAWKNRLVADFDGTLLLLKGVKPAAGNRAAPVHKPGKGAAASAAAHAENSPEEGDDPFMNRVNEIVAAQKVSEAEAQLIVCRENPKLYEAYRSKLLGLGSAA